MATLVRTCFYCAQEFEAAHPLANICSPGCRARVYPPRTKPRPVPDRASAAKVDPPPVGEACARCGKPVGQNGQPRRYCSSSCRRSMRCKTRKEGIRLKYVEPVSMTVLRARDQDTCRICGQPVDFRKKPPSPAAATIDHIVALAVGGEHSYNNTQLAHFRCNVAKGSS